MVRRVVLVCAALALLPAATGAAPAADDPLTFYPQAGILWQDLYIANHVDLDPGPGVLDYACGSQTYDTHTGQDSIIRSFREMDIGVPVFAALDGTVISTQDGFYDREYGNTISQFDNNVVVDHGGGRFTIYGHLRKGAILVRRGSTVVAGQQIGWTASSGHSSWPHLHFTYKENGEVVEPFAGPCRPGRSAWADQTPYPTAPYARDLAVSAQPFRGKGLLPFDQAVRTGTFVRGVRQISIRVEVGAAWNAERLRLGIARPIGTGESESRPFATSHGLGESTFTYRYPFDVTGRWHISVFVDDTKIVDAPLRVVASKKQVRNRPPNRIGVSLLPAAPTTADVLQCRIATSLATEDPDFDVVSYRYRWTIDGKAVRTVKSAALSDVLRHGLARPGSRVGCSVTPSDGRLSGPTATAAGTIQP